MKCVDINQSFNIYYKTNGLATGQIVLFNIWNENGQHLVSNQQGVEIGTDGVYHIQYTAPSASCYLLIVGSNNGNLPKADVVRVGSPSEKAFYVNGSFKTGQRIPYDIYDSTGSTIISGYLIDAVAGFYYTDVSTLIEPWFFEARPIVKKRTDCIAP